MRKGQLKEIANISFCTMIPSRLRRGEASFKWLLCSHFSPDNKIEGDFAIQDIVPYENWKLHKDDIVIKRIMPSYVNYIDRLSCEAYCGNNLIIVTPGDNVDPKYLAMVLNEQIGSVARKSSFGAVMNSVCRSDLEAMYIPLPNMKMQKEIGLLWYNAIELKKKKMRLAELENIKLNLEISKTMKMLGGKDNG